MTRKFYSRNKKRFTYEYTNFVFDSIANDISINCNLQKYLLNRISNCFGGYCHDMITTREYMSIISNCYTLYCEQIQLPVNEQINVY